MADTIGGVPKLKQTWHGLSKSAIYRTWGLIKQRCYNPTNASFPAYGGRGITMCDEWRVDFAAFSRDMGPRPSSRHTIERIDNDGPYAPWNCRWATKTEQARNRRSTHLYEYAGRAATIPEWSEITGIKRSTLAQRVYGLGWGITRAIETPVRPRGLRRAG